MEPGSATARATSSLTAGIGWASPSALLHLMKRYRGRTWAPPAPWRESCREVPVSCIPSRLLGRCWNRLGVDKSRAAFDPTESAAGSSDRP